MSTWLCAAGKRTPARRRDVSRPRITHNEHVLALGAAEGPLSCEEANCEGPREDSLPWPFGLTLGDYEEQEEGEEEAQE